MNFFYVMPLGNVFIIIIISFIYVKIEKTLYICIFIIQHNNREICEFSFITFYFINLNSVVAH